jgi:hypothetical protein
MVVAACCCFDAAALLLLRLPRPLHQHDPAMITRALEACVVVLIQQSTDVHILMAENARPSHRLCT